MPRLLLAIFILGAVGTAADLLLLGHFEDVLQFIPLILLAMAVGIAVWYGQRATSAARSAFQAVLAAFVMAGALGIFLHLRGNREFEIERDPSLGGLALFWEVITGATPALAPGSMILLAAIGYAAMKSRG